MPCAGPSSPKNDGDVTSSAHVSPQVVSLEDTTGTLPFGSSRAQKNCYTEALASNFEIRGAKYLKDKKKYKPDESMFELVGFDLYKTDQEHRSVLEWEDSVWHRAKRNAAAVGMPCPRYFIVHFMCPGEPNRNAVQYFAEKPFRDTTPEGEGYKRIMDNFFNTDNDKFRKQRFKMIPQCVQGPWLVKKAMGAPAIIGKKLDTYFNRNEDNTVVEVTIDVGSSMVARATLGTVSGALAGLIIDLAFTIEGKKADELPERLIGGVRVQHLNLESHQTTRDSPKHDFSQK